MSKALKAQIKEHTLHVLFDKRMRRAKQEYMDAVANTVYSNMCVNYRYKIFNPTNLPSRELSTQLYDVPEDSNHAKRLNRQIRVHDELEKATAHITYILNFVDTNREFQYVAFGVKATIPEERKVQLDEFVEHNQDRITFLKRMMLLVDLV